MRAFSTNSTGTSYGQNVIFTTVHAPTITTLSPTSGTTAGGTTVTLTGTNLTGVTAVTFGGTAATSVTVVSATSVTCVTPAKAAGAVNVVVTTPGGMGTKTAGYTFAVPVPTITSLSPTSGTTAGGTTVTLTGTNLTGATAVTFGGTAATSVAVVSATSVTCVTPAKAAGTVDVVVTTPGGTGTKTAGYTYAVPAPTIASLSPISGTIAGGTTVTLTGTNLTGATAVTFGGTAATSVTVVSATSVTCVTPARAAGAVNVVVTTPGGTGTKTAGYTFAVPAPTIASLSPTSGTTAGGTTVTLTGTNLSGATAVTFGGTAATSVTVISTTSVTCVTPVKAAGAVDVVVTTPGGTGTKTAGYTYAAPAPTITTLSPTSGPIAGGASITITGTTLTGATSVTFGGTAATIVSNTATQIVATAPAHAVGAVNVVVTTPNGVATKTNGYTYVAAPTITSLAPTSGFAAGGTSVTITGTNLTGATTTFGGTAATIVSTTATQIVATTPVHIAGLVNVVVTTSGGNATKTNGYTYLVAPVITSLAPTSGLVAGGGTVTITGTTLTGATSVTFGGTAATIVSNTATQIVATAPAHAAGAVNVVVTTPNGVATSTNGYTYNAAPAITSLMPTSGALAGGTSVTIVGTALTGATSVTFGGTAATIVSNTATQIVATAPAHAAGAVNVVVTTPYGVATKTNGYTYNNVPTIAFQAATSTITEGGVALDIPVVLSQAYTLPVTVNYALSGTATGGGDDYYLPNGTLTFAPGEISKSLIFQVRDDVTVESAETAIITLSAPTNSSLGTTKIHTVTIIDNDAITVQVTAGDALTFEDGSHFGSFIFTRSGSVAAALTANVTLSGSAIKGTDYTDPIGSTVIFPIGVSSVTKPVLALQDTLYEINETIIATVAAGTGYAVGVPSAATVTVRDDDVVTITASKPVAAEAATPVTGEFTLSRVGTAGALTVTLAISGTAATADYTRSWTGNTVIIPAGSSSVKLTITPVQDALVEGPKTVIVSITPTTYTVGAVATATVTITDDDVPTVSIAATDAIAAEPGGDKATFTISRAVSATTALTVAYQVTGTATSGLDYTTLTGTATIPANATSTTVTVTALGDQITEPDETVILTLSSSPTYNIAAAASATAVIKDCTISIVATDAIAMEPSGDNGIYTITRSFATAAAQTVQVAWGGSATLNTDFTTTPATTTTVTIPANATSTTVTLLPKADSLVEGTESALLSLVPTTTYAVGNFSAASVAIADATLTITVDRSEITENPSQAATATITRTGYYGAALTLAFTVSGTAINVQDYSRSSLISGSSILFPAGTSQVSGTFTTINDALIEGNETIIASIGPSSYGIINPSVTVTIRDDEFPAVSLEVADAAAGEAAADQGVFTLSRTGPTTNPLIVTLSRSGTATAVTDYTATPASITGTGTITVTIPAGQESTPITVTPVNDTISEPAETVILSVVSQTTYLVSTAQAQIAITDNDTPQVTITATSPQAAEGGASGVFTLQRIGNPLTAISVGFTLSGTATSGADFAALTSPVVLDANVTTKDIYLSTIDDALPENSETVTLTLVTGTGYTLGTNKVATVTIADNDLPTVTLATIRSAAEGVTPVTGIVRFTRTGNTATALSIPFTLSGTASTVAGTDYTLSPSASPISIAIGATTADLIITPVNNAVAAGDKTVIVTLGSGSFNPGAPNSATMTIADDERPTISIVATDNTATEAGLTTATFTVTRSAASATALTVPYTVSGSATAGIDYVALSGSVTLPAGQTSATVVVTPRDDADIETAESITLALKTGSGYVVDAVAPSATANIYSDDLPTPIVTYQFAQGLVAEGTGPTTDGLDLVAVLATTTTSGVTLAPALIPGGFVIRATLATAGITSAPVTLRYQDARGVLGPQTTTILRWPSGGGSTNQGDPNSAPLPPPTMTLTIAEGSLTGDKHGTLKGDNVAFTNTNGNAATPIQVNVSASSQGTIDRITVFSSDGQTQDVLGASGIASFTIATDGIYTFSATVTATRGTQSASQSVTANESLVVDRTAPQLEIIAAPAFWENPQKPIRIKRGAPKFYGTYGYSFGWIIENAVYLNANTEGGYAGNKNFREKANILAFSATDFSAEITCETELSGLRDVAGTNFIDDQRRAVSSQKLISSNVLQGWGLSGFGSTPDDRQYLYLFAMNISDRCGNVADDPSHFAGLFPGEKTQYLFNVRIRKKIDPSETSDLNVIPIYSPVRFLYNPNRGSSYFSYFEAWQGDPSDSTRMQAASYQNFVLRNPVPTMSAEDRSIASTQFMSFRDEFGNVVKRKVIFFGTGRVGPNYGTYGTVGIPVEDVAGGTIYDSANVRLWRHEVGHTPMRFDDVAIPSLASFFKQNSRVTYIYGDIWTNYIRWDATPFEITPISGTAGPGTNGLSQNINFHKFGTIFLLTML